MTLLGRISCECLALLALFAGTGQFALAQDDQTKPAIQEGALWLLDLGIGQGYDDSLIATGQGGNFTQFDPLLSFRQDREHGFWSLNFHPTVQHLYNFSIADRINESLSTLDSWQMSRRWTLDLSGSYLHTSDPFARSQEATEAPPIGNPGVVSPNSAFVGPESTFTVIGGSGTFHYQVRRHTELTFGGDYFSNRENAPGLPNTTSAAFRAAYTQTVRRGQSIGLNYSVQSFAVTNPEENITTNTLVVRYVFEWKTGRQLVLFAGPQYTSLSANSTSGTVPSPVSTKINQQVLDYSAGATLSLRITQQNFFQLMASRRIVDGAGVSGTVIQDEGRLGLSRRFSKRLSASIGSFYSEYQALGNLPVAEPSSWGAFNRAEIDLGPRSSLSMEYDYFHQAQIPSSLAPLFSHNRALIEYHHSLGTLTARR
jgi:hypothetical protein